MKWVEVLIISKDMPGLSETWALDVATRRDGNFARRTGAGKAIDVEPATLIAEYIIDNAADHETALIAGLSEVARENPKFIPLLDVVKKRLQP